MPGWLSQRFAEAGDAVWQDRAYSYAELGILDARSRASDSLWVRIGGEGVETQVRPARSKKNRIEREKAGQG